MARRGPKKPKEVTVPDVPSDITYLESCLKNGMTVRWPDGAMPIKVHIAPFHWYEQSKNNDAYMYNQMVVECLQRWTEVTNKKVRFQIVGDLQMSQINIAWRRVDRKSLGHCEYAINDRSMVYSAEIKIGISDGVLSAKYNDPDEVRHTILHEIGHAIGLLDHSAHKRDIMYVPHLYGVVDVSQRDIDTVNWLYNLPVGFNYKTIGKEKYQLDEPFRMNDVLLAMEGKTDAKRVPNTFEKNLKPRKENPEALMSQHDILSQMGKFNLMTQNIAIDPDVKGLYKGKKKPHSD